MWVCWMSMGIKLTGTHTPRKVRKQENRERHQLWKAWGWKNNEAVHTTYRGRGFSIPDAVRQGYLRKRKTQENKRHHKYIIRRESTGERKDWSIFAIKIKGTSRNGEERDAHFLYNPGSDLQQFYDNYNFQERKKTWASIIKQMGSKRSNINYISPIRSCREDTIYVVLYTVYLYARA